MLKFKNLPKNIHRLFSTTKQQTPPHNPKTLPRSPTLEYINQIEYEELKRNSKELRETILKDISTAGPISFARYMEMAMTDPKNGYYMKQDVFNKQGDFITSPEISQIFPELIGIWIVHFFQ